MIIAPGYIGIDVSKDHLDIFDDRTHRITNMAEVIAAWLAELPTPPRLVLFEATGRYDWQLQQQLHAAGISFARVNPLHARAFARATGQLAKTDAIDARLLAAMAQAFNPAPQPPDDPERLELAELHRRRAQLVSYRQQERTRLHTASPSTAPSIVSHLDWLDAQIKQLERQIETRIRSSTALTLAASLLRSIPSIGPVNAAGLLALMPELGQRSAKTIAALGGLAPINRDSGQFRGQRCIAGGRAEVRKLLYMAAVTASRSNSRFAETYKGLTANGKAAKLALIAVARKLLVTANAVLKTGQPFKA
jgi:transposase